MAENDQKNDLYSLKIRLREFAAARDWEQFHSPKNLSIALIKKMWSVPHYSPSFHPCFHYGNE